MLANIREKLVEDIVGTQRCELQDQNRLIGKDLLNVCFTRKKERILQNGDINLPYNNNAFATIQCTLGRYKKALNNILGELFHIFICLSYLYVTAN